MKVDLATHKLTNGDDYLVINPRGYVPLLELDDGSRHCEVAALLQYVGDLVPASGLMPPVGTTERFRVIQWLSFISSELHKAFSPWLWHKESADSTRKDVKERIARRFSELDQVLAQNEFIAGDQFTVADAYGFNIVSWAPMLGISLKPWPHLDAWRSRVAQRPAVQAVLQAEGLQNS